MFHIYYFFFFYLDSECTYIHETKNHPYSLEGQCKLLSLFRKHFYLLLFFFKKYKNIFAVSQEQGAGAARLCGVAAGAMEKGKASVPRTMVSLTGNIPNQNYKCAGINKAGVNLKLFYTLFY